MPACVGCFLQGPQIVADLAKRGESSNVSGREQLIHPQGVDENRKLRGFWFLEVSGRGNAFDGWEMPTRFLGHDWK